MIRLPSPVEYSDVIQPVSLACSSDIDVDVMTMGNGRTHSEDERLAPTLKYIHMKTIRKRKCFPFMPILAFHKNLICANGEQKQSVCDGDGGGALVETKSQYLIGIALSVPRELECNRGAPQTFTNVATPEHLKWIEKITNITCKKI